MTTIFAVIISAVLFWPGEVSKDASSRNQESRQISGSEEQVGNAVSDGLEKDNTAPKNESNGNENKYITIAELKNETSHNDTKSSTVSTNEEISQSNIEPAPQNKEKPINIDPATFQPIDGEQFFIKADLKLLMKLGFKTTSYGIFYHNLSPQGEQVIYNNFNFLSQSFDSIPLTQNDYYPVFETFMDGRIKSAKEEFDKSLYEQSNDTLLPIIIPSFSINEDLNDYILWFRVSESLFDILPNMDSHLKDKMRQVISTKRKNPELNLINYQLKPLLNNTDFLELKEKELKKLGFSKEDDSFILNSQINDSTISKLLFYLTMISDRKIINDSTKYHFVPIVSDRFGVLKYVETVLDYENLIPVLVKKEIWSPKFYDLTNDLIFWFLPTEGFFNSLPDSISTDLRKEYNYITAEDKSALVKPECKYFDECKNTLALSKFKVYPNPANSTATVSFTLPEAINGRIILVDLAGRERQLLQAQTNYAKGSHSIEVDVSSVPEGIYLITLYSNKGVQTQRFIVAR